MPGGVRLRNVRVAKKDKNLANYSIGGCVVTFAQAIADGFGKYAVFSGRSSRSAYWWWTLFAFIVTAAAYGVGLAIDSMVLYYVLGLVLFLPGLGVSVRRLHDVGRRGWWNLIALIPIIGAIVLLVWLCQPSEGPNKYGDGPDGSATKLGSPSLV